MAAFTFPIEKKVTNVASVNIIPLTSTSIRTQRPGLTEVPTAKTSITHFLALLRRKKLYVKLAASNFFYKNYLHFAVLFANLPVCFPAHTAQ